MTAKVQTNADRLLTQPLVAEVWPPRVDRFGYRVDRNGLPFMLPGMGGVTLGVHAGDRALGYAGDHVEPGLSVRHASPDANYAVQYLSCIGNTVTVLTGPAAGATGRVLGQHAYVLVDMPEAALQQVCSGDRVAIRAVGQGLELLDHPAVTVKNLDPGLLARLPVTTGSDGRLVVPVTRHVPEVAMGAGVGMASEFANVDLMVYDDGEAKWADGLRIGDVVALTGQDHRFGRGRRRDHVAIAVMSTGHCHLFGHGPGPSTILTGPVSAFDLVVDDAANVANFGWLEDAQ